MNNNTLQIKITQRLNKLGSFDSDNFECWQIAEAFNKAQIELVRDVAQGYNQKQENRESSLMTIDDLQILVKEQPLLGVNQKNYFLSESFPENYLYFKSIRAEAQSSTCTDPRKIRVFLAEETNADDFIFDENKKPSFEWEETFATILGNKTRIYTNNEFTITGASLLYYRKPRLVSFKDCVDTETGSILSDVECEFKLDIAEIIIDRAASILAGDIDNFNQAQRNAQNGAQHL